jgi:hypothetical protein
MQRPYEGMKSNRCAAFAAFALALNRGHSLRHGSVAIIDGIAVSAECPSDRGEGDRCAEVWASWPPPTS